MKKVFTVVEKRASMGYLRNRSTSNQCTWCYAGDTVMTAAVSAVKWLHHRGCNVMTMTPAKKLVYLTFLWIRSHNIRWSGSNEPLRVIKSIGNRKIGIVGASTTGMLALVAASYYKDISLTIAMTPCDFVMEGFYQDGKDGARSIPAMGESTLPIGENRFHTCPTPTATPSIGR